MAKTHNQISSFFLFSNEKDGVIAHTVAASDTEAQQYFKTVLLLNAPLSNILSEDQWRQEIELNCIESNC